MQWMKIHADYKRYRKLQRKVWDGVSIIFYLRGQKIIAGVMSFIGELLVL